MIFAVFLVLISLCISGQSGGVIRANIHFSDQYTSDLEEEYGPVLRLMEIFVKKRYAMCPEHCARRELCPYKIDIVLKNREEIFPLSDNNTKFSICLHELLCHYFEFLEKRRMIIDSKNELFELKLWIEKGKIRKKDWQ